MWRLIQFTGPTFWLVYNHVVCFHHIYWLLYIYHVAPLLKDLCEYFTPDYAARWKVIGTILGVPTADLEIIESDYFHRTVNCCNAMLQKWLEADPAATWQKLVAAVESQAVITATTGDSNQGKSELQLPYNIIIYTYAHVQLCAL